MLLKVKMNTPICSIIIDNEVVDHFAVDCLVCRPKYSGRIAFSSIPEDNPVRVAHEKRLSRNGK